MSRRGKIGLAVSLPIALVVSVILGLRWQAQWNLSAYRKKLIASGEKLTVAELSPKRNSEATNAALFLRLVSTIKPFWQYQPSAMKSIKPGVSRVAWRQVEVMETMYGNKGETLTNVWPALTEALTKNEQTMDEVQALVDEGGIEFIQDYSQPNLNNFNYLSQMKQLVMGLTSRTLLALHQGRRQEAFSYLKSCDAVSQLTAKDPIMIDQLVRYACMSVTAEACWEVLQTNGWTDGQLAELQRQWDQSDILAAAVSSIAMERARGPMEFQMARASRQGLDNMLGGNSGIKDNDGIWNDFLLNARRVPGELLTAYPRYWGWCWIWSYRDEQRYLEFMQTMIEATRNAQKRRFGLSVFADRDKSAIMDTPIVKDFDLAQTMTGGIERFITHALRVQTVANIVTTAIALERYRLAHHTYPDALAKLVPEFVQTVPVDCMDGHDLRYRLNADGTFLLYSVGDDGVDNGGDPTPQKGKSHDFFNGRDLVWPRAATAEEMQAYEAEQSKPAKRN
jgi:hypothetical protein